MKQVDNTANHPQPLKNHYQLANKAKDDKHRQLLLYLPKPLDKTLGHTLPQLSESFSKQQVTEFILRLKAPNQHTNLKEAHTFHRNLEGRWISWDWNPQTSEQWRTEDSVWSPK